jgi:hypothetical protein
MENLMLRTRVEVLARVNKREDYSVLSVGVSKRYVVGSGARRQWLRCLLHNSEAMAVNGIDDKPRNDRHVHHCTPCKRVIRPVVRDVYILECI